MRDPFKRFWGNRDGVAATEFAMMAPVLLILLAGFIEISARTQASEEADTYAKQVADLVSRETNVSSEFLRALQQASPVIITSAKADESISLDIASIGASKQGDPVLMWRRTSEEPGELDLASTRGVGSAESSVIRVGVRYRFSSPFAKLFGASAPVQRVAMVRPRSGQYVSLNGKADHGGAAQEIR